VGVSRPERVEETLEWAALELPEPALAELAQLSFDLGDPEADRVYKPG
jgi:D-threo-aldose 1-dehydrogenase